MDKIDGAELGTKQPTKGTKTKAYRKYRVKVNLDEQELARYAQMAVEAGFRPKAQKLFKIHTQSGKQTIDMKGIGKWIREAAVPDYAAHAWEREQKRAEALRKKQEAEAELAKYAQGQP